MSKDASKKGGFKLAYFGTSSRAIFTDSDNLRVCAKQAFYTQKKDVYRAEQQKMVQLTQNIPYSGHQQMTNLATEVTCLVWANALLEMVYAHIDRFFEKLPENARTVPIPQMRFVKAAIAVDQGPNRECFLLEEEIPNDNSNGFRKYLNNTSAVPNTSTNPEYCQRGEFLAFCQHLQYYKTDKRAFTADFQGMF